MQPLTMREWQVFELIKAGKLESQIAAQLKIDERSVAEHRRRIMLKTESLTVADLLNANPVLG